MINEELLKLLESNKAIGIMGEIFLKVGKIEIEITNPTYRNAEILLDGKDITKFVQGITLDAHVGEIPRINIDFILF